MSDKKTVLTIDALLKNGREVFLTIELPRDEVVEADGIVTYRINAEAGVVEEHIFHSADVAYMRRREAVESLRQSEYRTLGREAVVPSR